MRTLWNMCEGSLRRPMHSASTDLTVFQLAVTFDCHNPRDSGSADLGLAGCHFDRGLSGAVRSGDEGSPFWRHLFAWLGRGPPAARQLQHRCMLTLPKAGNQHDLPVGELQRIVVRQPLIEVHLPEAGDLVARHSGLPHPGRREASDVFFECKLCTREQTDGYAGLAWIRKAARDRISKECRYKLVTDFGWSGRNVVKTVVTHRTPPVVQQPRRRPSSLGSQPIRHGMCLVFKKTRALLGRSP